MASAKTVKGWRRVALKTRLVTDPCQIISAPFVPGQYWVVKLPRPGLPWNDLSVADTDKRDEP